MKLQSKYDLAIVELRNYSPKPGLRSSYQLYAATTSCCASGAIISSGAMVTLNPVFNLVPISLKLAFSTYVEINIFSEIY